MIDSSVIVDKVTRNFTFGCLLCILMILTSAQCTEAVKNQSADSGCPATRDIPAGMACIPSGEFIYGSMNAKWADEHPQVKVYISAFLIDKYEVTTADYQKCVAAGKCANVISNYVQMRGANQPQLKVSWFEARDYCRVQGKRLPTEAEFEKASRGTAGDTYPWGNETANCRLAVIQNDTGRGCTDRFGVPGSTSEVGSRPAGYYGLFDMAGNAHEWVNDWYAPDRQKCGAECLGKDPAGPCGGKDVCPGYTEKVIKGGSWYWDADWARAAKRRAYIPANRPPHHFGFRCARSL
ncbi:MAG: SUMF1/EgtB/PvdO family nonheme iron enzyme [Leptospiraceae bacterium]|nr:SUMF1/EgtB/PvdO family nonheme iron enzyme [Leptospiraceae bacterium]